MATARTVEHARVVLSAILQGRRDLMDQALRHLTSAHFPDSALSNIFTIVDRYATATGAVVTPQAFADLLRSSGADPGRIALYAETFNSLVSQKPLDHEFTWSVRQLQDDLALDMTGKALAAGLEQLTGTADPPKHLENLSMHTRARSLVMEMFGQIDRDLNLSDSPEGDVRTESQQIFEDYAKRVADRKLGRSGILTGLLPIDLYTSGFQNGDLVLFPAYTSEGKTQLCVHLAHHCAVHQRKNVYMATSETIRPQVIRRIIARHSKEPMFGLPDGINSKWLKMGDIPQELLDSYKLVVQDFTTNPAYGKLHVAQIPRGSTIAQLEQRVQSVQRSWDVDLVIIDYLALLRPERHRQSGWEEKSDILKDAKMLAVTFAEGRGVPVVSPWQFSRSGYETALRTGYYKLSDLSESAEAEKSSDLIIPLLRMAPPEDPRRVELKAQVLKNRDGETAEAISLLCDYTTSTFSVPQSNASMEALLEN